MAVAYVSLYSFESLESLALWRKLRTLPCRTFEVLIRVDDIAEGDRP